MSHIITPDDYHNDTSRISKSGLDEINRSPAHYYAKYIDPNREPHKETPALITGSVVHCAVFEPNELEKRFVAHPVGDGRTVAVKKAWADFEFDLKSMPAGIKPVHPSDIEDAQILRDLIRKHPVAKEFLNDGVSEQRVDWTDEHTGAPCKCKPDWYDKTTKMIVDLKTTEDAGIKSFGKSAFNYRYHVQAPFYLDGMRTAGHDVEGFIFIVIEKSAPFGINVFFTPPEVLELGRMRYIENLQTYMKCIETGEFPCYEEIVKPLELPSYALKQF